MSFNGVSFCQSRMIRVNDYYTFQPLLLLLCLGYARQCMDMNGMMTMAFYPTTTTTTLVGMRIASSIKRQRRRSTACTGSVLSTTSQLWLSNSDSNGGTGTGGGPLPDGYQDYGNAIIRNAAKEQEDYVNENNVDDIIQVEWKPGKIIVTVNTQHAYMETSSSSDDDADDDDDENELLEDEDYGDDDDADLRLPQAATNASDGGSGDGSGIDVTKLARAINYGFDDGEDGVGTRIAETHEIEVTTPGASNEIQGRIMFEAYKGFDVICEFWDKKTKKNKILEGRLHERTDEHTVINIKGRMKKLQNEQLISVKLPKAKREKGAK